MAYTTPTFNLLAHIWDCKTPADGVQQWSNVPCQKYILSRMSVSASPQSIADYWKTYPPPVQLRFPRSHAAFTPIPSAWTHLVFEVPAGSGQYYRCFWRDVQHQGFVNEYAIILCVQCDNAGKAIPPPGLAIGIGVGSDACTVAQTPVNLRDGFDGAVGSNLLTHPMDSGPGWAVGTSGSAWVIGQDGSSTRATGAGQGGFNYAWSDGYSTWRTNQTLWRLNNASGDTVAATGRVADHNNMFIAEANFATHRYSLRRRITGTETALVDQAMNYTFSTNDQLIIALGCQGSSISAQFTGPQSFQIQQLSVTDVNLASNTKWGLRAVQNQLTTCFTMICDYVP